MLANEILAKAFSRMCTSGAMAQTYEENRQKCRYVHSTSRGHEAIQLAAAAHLLPCDWVSPYYRDESLLLGLGFSPFELMSQLLAKASDPFSGGRAYYAHPCYQGAEFPRIMHQSSATGMQAIPSTGLAQGIAFLEKFLPDRLRRGPAGELPIVLCSLGDACLAEGEVSEAFQMAVLRKLPILFLVQDNTWGISVTAGESRAMDATGFAAGFPGMGTQKLDGSDFETCYRTMEEAVQWVRTQRNPMMVQALVPLLGHHTSGVRMESYREPQELSQAKSMDPRILLEKKLKERGFSQRALEEIQETESLQVKAAFEKALEAPEPSAVNLIDEVFAATPVSLEVGQRSPEGSEKILFVDAALHALAEILEEYPEAIYYGQDVGRRLGGVFRESATLAARFGEHRVFNSAIQEAYIIGSSAGLSAAGLRPIAEIQFGDYLFPGINQLASELAKSFFLTQGKFPVHAVIRVPVGAYGGGGPYHSASIESLVLSIKGLKVAFPSNAADMKGLMKAAFLDPNPVVMLEHKGLYWSKVPGTEDAKTQEPSRDYVLPLGKGRLVQAAENGCIHRGESGLVVTYGMGVYWAKAAAREFLGAMEIVDLRTLMPLDEDLVFERVRLHGKCLVVTEEALGSSFAEALAARISQACFSHLDGPVEVLGALALPAVPLNQELEAAMLPSAKKLALAFRRILDR